MKSPHCEATGLDLMERRVNTLGKILQSVIATGNWFGLGYRVREGVV